MKFPTLYRYNGKKITQWSIYTDNNIYYVQTGYTDGKQKIYNITVEDPGIYGSPSKHAESISKSLWNNKSKDMYSSIDLAISHYNNRMLSLGGYKPMTAETFNKDKLYFSLDGALVQPKYDGKMIISCKVNDEVLLYSKSGAPQTTTPHINEQLNIIMKNGDIFQGEIYKHGMTLEEILSCTQSTENPKNTSHLEYHIYDFPKINGLSENSPYVNRLSQFNNYNMDDVNNIIRVPTTEISSYNDLTRYHKYITEMGYEGAIIRNPISGYQNKRSKDLLKLKDWFDAEFVIVGIKEGEKSLKGYAGSFQCMTSDGKLFNAKLEGEISNLKQYFDDPDSIIGKYVTVKYHRLTKYGIPRDPVAVRIRS